MTVRLEIEGSSNVGFWIRPLLFGSGALVIANVLLGHPQWEGGAYMQWWERVLFAAAFAYVTAPLIWQPMQILNHLGVGSDGVDVCRSESKWMFHPSTSKSFSIKVADIKQVVLYNDSEGEESCRIDLVGLADGCASIDVPKHGQGKSIKEQAQEIGRVLDRPVIEQQ